MSLFRSSSSRRLAALSFAALTLAAGTAAQAQTVFAVTVQGNLISFNAASPGTITTIGPVSGPGISVPDIRGIDFRPATSQLYLLQGPAGGNPDRLYVVDTFSGNSTLVANTSAPIVAAPLGMDFNPVADALRVVTSSTNNYRINANTGVVTTETAALISPSGNSPFITGSAYTNSIFGGPAPASTMLFNIDSRNSTLNLQATPINGINTVVGNLGIDLTGVDAGFDIFFSGTTNTGFISANPAAAGISTFYTINLNTGAATSVGAIGGGVAVRDIAVIPAPGAIGLAGLGLLLAIRSRKR